MPSQNSINNTIANNNFTVPNGTITASGTITTTAGDIAITAGNITMPFSNAAGTQGTLLINGNLALNSLGIGNFFMGIGAGNLTFNTGLASANVGFGLSVLSALTTGTSNTSIGYNNLTSLTTGSSNTAVGSTALGFLVTGSSNIAIGPAAGRNFTGAESDNIDIGNLGVLGESATIRIGTNGTQTKAYIAGIDGVNVGSVAKVVTMASDQLGTATITAGTGITVTPGANTITIATSGTSTLTYTLVNTTPYVVLTTDEFLGVDCSGGSIQINLPNAPSTGRTFVIKDITGSANTNPITVTTVGGVVLIDAAATYSMNTQYTAINVLFNGTKYLIY